MKRFNENDKKIKQTNKKDVSEPFFELEQVE